MQKIINRILLIIIIVLISLLAYKYTQPSNSISVPVEVTAQEEPELENFQEKVEMIIKEYLVNNPEVIIDAIEQLQKRKVQEMESKVNSYMQKEKSEIENSSNSPVIGNENGDVTIISFYDYNCSYCKKGNDYINKLLESDNKIKVVMRPFPILGEHSIYLAKIALAVYRLEPSKFKVIHEGLMNLSQHTKAAVKELLITEGLDINKVMEEAENQDIKKEIDKNFSLAGNLRIQGAPAYIINGKLMPGLLSLSSLQQIVSESRDQH